MLLNLATLRELLRSVLIQATGLTKDQGILEDGLRLKKEVVRASNATSLF